MNAKNLQLDDWVPVGQLYEKWWIVFIEITRNKECELYIYMLYWQVNPDWWFLPLLDRPPRLLWLLWLLIWLGQTAWCGVHLLQPNHPPTPRKKEGKKKHKNRQYSLTCGIHQVEFTTVVHDIWYNWILPELMYKRRNLLVKHETLCSAVDEPGIILEALFVERGGVGGNVIVNYVVTIYLMEG